MQRRESPSRNYCGFVLKGKVNLQYYLLVPHLTNFARLDCRLELQTSSRDQVMGHITVRLEKRSSGAPSPEEVNKVLAQLPQETPVPQVQGMDDEDPMEVLCSLLDRMRPLIPVLDSASKVRA